MDERFADWAEALGVEHGPLNAEEKQTMIEHLDAVVAYLYGLSPDQLTHIYDTFHEWNGRSKESHPSRPPLWHRFKPGSSP